MVIVNLRSKLTLTKMGNDENRIESPFARTELMLGADAMQRLAQSRVAVFGIGGVGGYVVEALARSGVGALDLIDDDTVSVSNINRQIFALHSTIGRDKVDVAAERVLDINPQCKVATHKMFYLPENADEIDMKAFDYVVDSLDTITAKMEIARRCLRLGVTHICSMGAAYKMDPMAFRVADFDATRIDPLARMLRKLLHREGIHHFKCVYSEEEPRWNPEVPVYVDGKKQPGSNAFVPAAAGLLIAREVIVDLTAGL